MMKTSSPVFVVAALIYLVAATAVGEELERAPLTEPLDPNQLRNKGRIGWFR